MLAKNIKYPCVLSNRISVIPGRVEDDNEGFCTTKRRLCAGLNEYRLQRDSINWMTSTSCFNVASTNRSSAQKGL